MRLERVLAIAACLLGVAGTARAQDVNSSETLPQGLGVVSVSPGISFGTEQFGPNFGLARESIVRNFNNIDLTQLFLGSGAADLGTRFGITSFDATQLSVGLSTVFAYGITHRLTIAVVLPWNKATTHLHAAIVPDPAHPAMGIAIADDFDCPGGFGGQLDPNKVIMHLPPEQASGYVLSIRDLNALARSPCFQYRPITDKTGVENGVLFGTADRSYDGIGDMPVAFRYKFYSGEHIKLAVTNWNILPTGKIDDPDDLFDVQMGDGQIDSSLLGNFEYDDGPLHFATTAGYEIQFGDQKLKRVLGLSWNDDLEGQLARGEITEKQLFDQHLDEASLVPISPKYDEVNVHRKLGDNIYWYGSIGYEVTPWFIVGASFDFIYHFRDEYFDLGPHPDGKTFETEADIRARLAADPNFTKLNANDQQVQISGELHNSAGRRAASLEWRTLRKQFDGSAGFAINTLPWVQSGAFPIPMVIGVSYHRVILGQNVGAPESFSMSLTLPVPILGIPDMDKYGPDDGDGTKPRLPYP